MGATEKEVTDALEALELTISQLVNRANTSDLNTEIENTEALDKDAYTPKSLESFNVKLEEAKNASTNPNAIQEEVDNATKALLLAIDNLVKKADKSDLNTVIDTIKEMEKKDYTKEIYQVYQEALTRAKEILEDENATEKQVIEAIANLNKAIENLKRIDSPSVVRPNDSTGFSSISTRLATVETFDDTNIIIWMLGILVSAMGYKVTKRRKKYM